MSGAREAEAVLPVQEFYGHFQKLEGPKRLLGFSKAGKQHYASPGEQHNEASTSTCVSGRNMLPGACVWTAAALVC